jgi:hypothetical protein
MKLNWLSPELIVLSFSITFDRLKEFSHSLGMHPTANSVAFIINRPSRRVMRALGGAEIGQSSHGLKGDSRWLKSTK